jgi:hypothetical protein
LTINDKWFIIITETKKGQSKGEKVERMKTIELLNKVVELGFSREKALADIDANLDEVIGAENRKPIAEEEISEELASDILFGFECEKENN